MSGRRREEKIVKRSEGVDKTLISVSDFHNCGKRNPQYYQKTPKIPQT